MAQPTVAPAGPDRRALHEQRVDELVHAIRAKALEAAREVDALGNGRLRLVVQGLLDSATDAVEAIDGEIS